jgi:hypothetical protein
MWKRFTASEKKLEIVSSNDDDVYLNGGARNVIKKD